MWLANRPVATASKRANTDWPQWRGANRDGAATFSVPATWPEQLTMKWKVEVGIGYAAPITVGDRVYAFSRQNEDEVMRALDAATGKTIWETKYNATYKPNPAATRTHGTGPKSTPTFADGRLYTLGMSGLVTAFDAADRQAALADAAAEDRTALSHRDVADRRSRSRDRARRRPQRRRADGVRCAHRRREVGVDR